MCPRYLTQCPKAECRSTQTRVLKIRYDVARGVIRRHRRCRVCGTRWRTEHPPEQFAGLIPTARAAAGREE